MEWEPAYALGLGPLHYTPPFNEAEAHVVQENPIRSDSEDARVGLRVS